MIMKTSTLRKCFFLSFIFLLAIAGSVQAQSTLKTSKKVYAKADTVVFYYKYTGEWESTWLVVTPTIGKGDPMTTAADLYGNPATRKFFNRFRPAKYKAELWGNFENGHMKKLLAKCSFEVKKQ
jgi:hypothetical protein